MYTNWNQSVVYAIFKRFKWNFVELKSKKREVCWKNINYKYVKDAWYYNERNHYEIRTCRSCCGEIVKKF